MRINLRDIPEGGRHLAGEIGEDLFQLGQGEPRPAGPLRYDLHAELVADTLVVQGILEVDFEVTCVRCLDPFLFRVTLPEAIFAEEIGDRTTIDLTDAIREDILLALPDHPHCEEANPPRICPAHGLFEEPEDKGKGEPGNGPKDRDQWAGLEGFDPGKPDT